VTGSRSWWAATPSFAGSCSHTSSTHLPGVMPSYTVTVATGSQWFAGTDDYIYLSLIGSAGCSEKHLLDKAFYNDFERGAVRMRAWDRRLAAKSGRAAGQDRQAPENCLSQRARDPM
jgi:hypothetical protein